MVSGSSLPGPRVATIFVRRHKSLTDKLPHFARANQDIGEMLLLKSLA